MPEQLCTEVGMGAVRPRWDRKISADLAANYEARMGAGVSQRALAAALDVPRARVTGWSTHPTA